MRRLPKVLGLVFSAALLAGAAQAQDSAQNVKRIEIGIVDCIVEGGSGYLIGSTKDLRCTFDPAGDDGQEEAYFGSIRKWGLDIGITDQTVMKWAVLAPTRHEYKPGALSGDYVGISGQATLGVGLGANALFGGSSKTVVLQPVSVQAQEGLNIALGVAEIELRSIAD